MNSASGWVLSCEQRNIFMGEYNRFLLLSILEQQNPTVEGKEQGVFNSNQYICFSTKQMQEAWIV
jgi:hypothetical protein